MISSQSNPWFVSLNVCVIEYTQFQNISNEVYYMIEILKKKIFITMNKSMEKYHDKIIDYFISNNTNSETFMDINKEYFVNDLLKHIGNGQNNLSKHLNQLHDLIKIYIDQMQQIAVKTMQIDDFQLSIQHLDDLYGLLNETEQNQLKPLMEEWEVFIFHLFLCIL